MVGNVQSAKVEALDHDNSESAQERRKKERQLTVFRLAKITSGTAEGWGFIKNISGSGVMIEIHPSFELKETATVALTDDVALTATIRWRKDALVGMQFKNEINVNELLASLRVHNKYQLSRLPRVHMRQAIVFRIGSTLVRAEICDISPAGIRINADYICEVGNQLTLVVPDLGDIAGTVRWQKGSEIGIKFHQRVSIPQITDWLANFYTKEITPESGCRVELG
jgi:PilZ domain